MSLAAGLALTSLQRLHAAGIQRLRLAVNRLPNAVQLILFGGRCTTKRARAARVACTHSIGARAASHAGHGAASSTASVVSITGAAPRPEK